jgi:Domain found in Dishevelled, Egl-10, and Pleckstrin (DEP)
MPGHQTDTHGFVCIDSQETTMNTYVLLALPHDAAHKSARALVMALGLIPEAVKDGADALPKITQQLQSQTQSAALVDLSSLPRGFKHIQDLAKRLPPEVRQRVILFRHEQGPVWPSDQVWVKELGFAGLFAEVDAQAILADAELPNLLAQLTGRESLPGQKLSQYFAAMLAKPDPLTLRGLIRAQSGRSAESLAQVMASGVKAVDRMHRLTRYPACFLGTEAVQWLRSQFQCSSANAVHIGQALLSLGLLHHVVHEHGFENAEYFYRLDATANTSQTPLGLLLAQLQSPQGLIVKDRSYLGKLYPACWIGQEAVDWLSIKMRLPRHEAENLLNRLLSYGLVEHVMQAHRVKDANLFFRFR